MRHIHLALIYFRERLLIRNSKGISTHMLFALDVKTKAYA